MSEKANQNSDILGFKGRNTNGKSVVVRLWVQPDHIPILDGYEYAIHNPATHTAVENSELERKDKALRDVWSLFGKNIKMGDCVSQIEAIVYNALYAESGDSDE